MRELTIEEKAARYDEAIDVARKINSGEGVATPSGWTTCEVIFPELKESEDERIGKELIEFVKSRGGFKQEYIAWLEKQGGKKPFTIDIDKMVEKYAMTRQGDFGMPVNCQVKAYRQGINDVLRLALNLEKQGEQKPLFKKGDTVFWDGEEFNILDVTKDSYNVGGYIIPICRQNELLLKQKSADKVEPKFRIGDFVKNTNYQGEPIYEIVYMDKECYICEYRGKENMGDKTVIHFAFDNPYLRLVEQKFVWSEEDEDYINDLIKYFSQNERLKNTKEDIVIWLKSLKYQNKWKPSEEQMEVLLSEVTAWTKGCPKQKILETLYNDLKKLRDE